LLGSKDDDNEQIFHFNLLNAKQLLSAAAPALAAPKSSAPVRTPNVAPKSCRTLIWSQHHKENAGKHQHGADCNP
jgi:hypothetical protein